MIGRPTAGISVDGTEGDIFHIGFVILVAQ
jgi:hypothetical protein